MKKTGFKLFMLIVSMAIIPGWVASPLRATFRDSLGREITLNEKPGRIVSLAPNLTEILYFLGLGDRVAGVTRFSYYPPEADQQQ